MSPIVGDTESQGNRQEQAKPAVTADWRLGARTPDWDRMWHRLLNEVLPDMDKTPKNSSPRKHDA